MELIKKTIKATTFISTVWFSLEIETKPSDNIVEGLHPLE